MKTTALLLTITLVCYFPSNAQRILLRTQEMRTAAVTFLESLTTDQKQKTSFAFDDEERYNWNFVPIARKGIPLKELNAKQQTLAMQLLSTALSDTGFKKTKSVIALEAILKKVENRPDGDDYRDAGKYYFAIFGNPSKDSIWGWRLEGHHVAFNFSSDAKGLVSGTPGFLGANPAVVLSGEEKGKEILKEETAMGFALLHALSDAQKEKAIFNTRAPREIITGRDRKAMIAGNDGIQYGDLTKDQQKLFLQLVHLYLYRYKKALAAKMMTDIEQAGLMSLRFAWAGAQQPGVGNPHYYRIYGPTLIIEYDNTQNNANHVHTVVRDLRNDFGGDQLLEHYKHGKH
jgi:hypothetical protein